MTRRSRRPWRILAVLPLLSLYNFASCQANVLRDVASNLDERADDLDKDDDIDLGDYLAELVEGL